MKALLVTLSLTALTILSALPAVSQSTGADSAANSRDSVCYARLKTGQTVYSSSMHLHRSLRGEAKYLALDNGRTIPIEQVDRFHAHAGVFVTVPGSAGTDVYRLDRGGPKISLYSRLVYDPLESTSNTDYSRREYFRKAGDQQMQRITYLSLTSALADNPAAEQKVHTAAFRYYTGASLLLASILIEGIGAIQTARKNAPHFVTTTSSTYPYMTTSASVASGHTLSPLLFVGAGAFAGGIVLYFGGRNYAKRAIDIYNGEP